MVHISKTKLKNEENTEDKNRTIWENKYDPKSFKKRVYVGNNEHRKAFKKYVETKNCPNILLVGRAGIGKTSTARTLAIKLGKYSENILFLNASDYSGVNDIRTIVKEHVKRPNRYEGTFKVVILDEADNLSRKAQQTLRFIINRYTKVIWILTGNYADGFIDPIVSRLKVHEMKPVSKEEIVVHLKYIAEKESLEVKEDKLYEIAELSNGDLRKAKKKLQSLYDKTYVSNTNNRKRVLKFLKLLIDKDLKGLQSYIKNYVYELLSFKKLLESTVEYLVTTEKISQKNVDILLRLIGELDYNTTISGNIPIQVYRYAILINENIEKKQ